MTEDPSGESEERQRRTFVNLVAAILLLVVAIAAVWLFGYIDDKRKIEACVEAGRRDCLQRFDPSAAPPS